MKLFKRLAVKAALKKLSEKHLVTERNVEGTVEYTLTDQVPEWMQKTFALGGIGRSFTLKNLTDEQKDLFEVACGVTDLQNEGLIEIKYDPKTEDEPILSLTEKGRQNANKIL